MSLRRKVLAAFSLLWIGLLVSFWIISSTFVEHGFFKVERDSLHDKSRQIRAVIEAELEALQTNAITWAYWDDMYDYARSKSPAFVRSNLQDASLVDFNIHEILILDLKGRILVSRSYDPTTKKVSALARDLRETLKNPTLWRHPRVDHFQKGLISLNNRPALFVSLPILTSLKRGPIRGSLVFIRHFDDVLIRDLSKKIGAPLRWNLESPQSEVIQAQVTNWPEDQARAVWLSDESVSVELKWSDLLNTAQWTSLTSFDRPITKEAQNTTVILFFFLTVAGGLFGFAFYRAIQSALERLDESQRDLKKSLQESQSLTLSLEKAQKQLIQSQKFEALSALAGGVARDFKAVIASLSAILEALEHDLKNQPESMRRLSHLSMSIARATEVVQKLLGLVRKTDTQKETLELNKIIFDVQELLAKSFGGQIKVRTSTAAKLWQVDGSADQITQALVNLGMNARDAMPDGGQILFESENLDLTAINSKRPANLKPGKYVSIRISDTGQGISPEIHEKIFDPFFTTKTGATSAGLGLSTVYSIMQNHGGQVTLYSEPRLGSVFTLYFPLSEGEAVELQPLRFDLSRVSSVPEFDGRLILLADDDYLLREVTRDIFESEQAVVLAAETGKEALQIFDEHSDSLRLAILDYSMPEKTGLDVYHEIRRKQLDFPIIICTAYGDLPELMALKQDPWFVCVGKPFQRRELIELAWAMINARETDSTTSKHESNTGIA